METLLRSKPAVYGIGHIVLFVGLTVLSGWIAFTNFGLRSPALVSAVRWLLVGAALLGVIQPALRFAMRGAGFPLRSMRRLIQPPFAGAFLVIGIVSAERVALAHSGAAALAVIPAGWGPLVWTGALLVLVAGALFVTFVQIRKQRTGQPVEQLLNAIADGLVVLDRQGKILYVNTRAEEIFGFKGVAGKTAGDLFPQEVLGAYREALTQGPTESECCCEGRWYEVRAYPSPVGVSLYIREVTDRKRTEEERLHSLAREQAASTRLRLLAESSALLSASLEYPLDAIRQIVRLAVPQAADWAGAYLAGEEGTEPLFAYAHAKEDANLAALLSDHYGTLASHGGFPRLLTSGETLFYQEMSAAELQRLVDDADQTGLLQLLQPKSLIRVDICTHGRFCGSLVLVMTDSGRRYDPDDLAMAEDLARRTAAAVDHAVLYQEAQEAARRAERQAEALQEQERLYRLVTDNSRDVVSLHGRDGKLLYISPSCEPVLGYTQGELVGCDPAYWIHPDDVRHARAAYLSLRRGTPVGYRVRRKSGEYIWFETVSQPIRDRKGRIVQIQASSRDITERKAFEEQLARQAYTDSLTGLCNRVALIDRIEHALIRAARRHEQVAIVFLDLDNFKVVNDSLGHEAGDQLLVFLARRLQACLRAEDTAARLGGDEFTILLEGITEIPDVVRVVERIAAALQTPFSLDGHEVFVTFSIGITLSRKEQQDPRELLREADVAMYYAKHRGKARYAFFDASMNFRLLERLDLETDLRRAIERQEFRVYYQPMIDLASGAVSGVEALVRWEHPERGLIYPDEFIPVAEETGLILQIGEWVLREACRQARSWGADHGRAESLIISVNLSPGQLLQPDLPEIVARTLRETGMKAANLQLEITESVLMHDVEVAIRVLNELKLLGVQLAIDDFGTGYSALSYFKRFPFDVLKIDRTFVKGLGEDRQDSAIVQTVIMLAKTLDLVVVGEGIETTQQLGQLQVLGCDRGQGYHFARPMPGDQVSDLLRSLPGEFSI